jgi:hypothetical protein
VRPARFRTGSERALKLIVLTEDGLLVRRKFTCSFYDERHSKAVGATDGLIELVASTGAD